MDPKFAIFASRLWLASTDSIGILNTAAAVAVWMSCPADNAPGMFEDEPDDRVLLAQRLERVGVSRIARLGAPADREAQVFEQHLRQLLGSAEVELLPRHLFDLGLEGGHLRAELVLHFFQVGDVD